MTTTRRAPYRHADGSNCWTKNCSKNAGVSNHSHLSNSTSPQPTSKLGRYEAQVRKAVGSIARTGKQMNKSYHFSTVFTKDRSYSPRYVRPVKNADYDLIATKPKGGLWAATVDEEGLDSWSRFLGETSAEKSEEMRTRMHFKPDAKVLVIDSLNDYRKILIGYAHYAQPTEDSPSKDYVRFFANQRFNISGINSDGTARRNIDWEKLGKDYDAVMVTGRGVSACGKSHDADLQNDVSLWNWDFESLFVMNKNAVRYEEK